MADIKKKLEAKLATLTVAERAKYERSIHIFIASEDGNNKLSMSDSKTIETARIQAEKYNQIHRRIPERMLNRRYTI
jgi:hypothetical protein